MRLFDLYVFADYSGASRDAGKVEVWKSGPTGNPKPIRDGISKYSRQTARIAVERLLDDNDATKVRVVLGFDHQYSWPPRLWNAAKLNDLPWREAIRVLNDGVGGRPQLDIPARYCAAFNAWCGFEAFWAPIQRKAQSYKISSNAPTGPTDSSFRVTERASPFRYWPPKINENSRPKPADAVGGQGEGAVGGQTICGLAHITKLLKREDLAWWPFDGLHINDPAFAGKHVAVEIYPEIKRPKDIRKSDENDSIVTCKYVRWHDKNGRLETVMDLRPVLNNKDLVERIRQEGWILGMDPSTVLGKD